MIKCTVVSEKDIAVQEFQGIDNCYQWLSTRLDMPTSRAVMYEYLPSGKLNRTCILWQNEGQIEMIQGDDLIYEISPKVLGKITIWMERKKYVS